MYMDMLGQWIMYMIMKDIYIYVLLRMSVKDGCRGEDVVCFALPVEEDVKNVT